jgi:hypothetical protein
LPRDIAFGGLQCTLLRHARRQWPATRSDAMSDALAIALVSAVLNVYLVHRVLTPRPTTP